jgi:hypothetical protein
MHDTGCKMQVTFLTTVNPSTVNCSLNHDDHEEQRGKKEVFSIFKYAHDLSQTILLMSLSSAFLFVCFVSYPS